jgi:ABC-type multidrug transport system fused ATPase/permease subunit
VEHLFDYQDMTARGFELAKTKPAPAAWPSTSIPILVSVQDLVITNSSKLSRSIDGVTFDLGPQERVALVGRHGSGKSTLALALMKFADPISGRISIDGLDIFSLDTKELRSRFVSSNCSSEENAWLNVLSDGDS